jgi:hypothetical protein
MKGSHHEPEYRRRLREKAEKDESEANKKKRESQYYNNIVKITLLLQKIGERSTRDSNEEKTYRKRNFWVNLLGVIGVWLAGAVAIIAILVSSTRYIEQWQIMRDQLSAMHNDQRPWIAVKPFLGKVSWKDGGLDVAAKFEFENTGKGPALKVIFHIELYPFDVGGAAILPAQRLQQIAKSGANGVKYTFPLMTGQKEEVYPKLTIERARVEEVFRNIENFARENNQTITDSEARAYLSVDVLYVATYVDTYEETHQYICMDHIYRVDEANPLGAGLDLQVGVDIAQPKVVLRASPLFCKVD